MVRKRSHSKYYLDSDFTNQVKNYADVAVKFGAQKVFIG
jgi:hypothetical protein